MQKLFTKREIIPILIIVSMFIAGAMFYSKMPAVMPTHWNARGQVDGYSSKGFMAFGFPAVILGIYLLITLLPLIDPLRKNIEKSAGAYFWMRTLFASFFAALYFFGIYAGVSSGKNIMVRSFSLVLMGALFIGLGFLMPHFKRNYFIGIRTPWTLESGEVWDITHKRAKNWFIAGGAVVIIGGLIEQTGAWPIFAGILFLLYAVVDSYFIYKKIVK